MLNDGIFNTDLTDSWGGRASESAYKIMFDMALRMSAQNYMPACFIWYMKLQYSTSCALPMLTCYAT